MRLSNQRRASMCLSVFALSALALTTGAPGALAASSTVSASHPAAAKPKPKPKVVYRWYDLADYREASGRGGLYRRSGAELGGETVSSAVTGPTNGTKMWAIGGACSQIRGVVGADGNDPTAKSTVKVSVLADSRKVVNRVFKEGESAPFAASLRGVAKLTIGIVENRFHADSGAGNVQVYCTRAPGVYHPV